jgi:hypothetical protein
MGRAFCSGPTNRVSTLLSIVRPTGVAPWAVRSDCEDRERAARSAVSKTPNSVTLGQPDSSPLRIGSAFHPTATATIHDQDAVAAAFRVVRVKCRSGSSTTSLGRSSVRAFGRDDRAGISATVTAFRQGGRHHAEGPLGSSSAQVREV